MGDGEAPGQVVGSIIPPKRIEDPPTYTVLGRKEPWTRKRDEDACEHGDFILDEKWSTVKCGMCEVVIQPFDILLRQSEFEETVKRRVDGFQRAEQNSLVAELRSLSRRSKATPEERQEIGEILESSYRHMTENRPLRDMATKVREAIQGRS